jgi:hypothetical protein
VKLTDHSPSSNVEAEIARRWTSTAQYVLLEITKHRRTLYIFFAFCVYTYKTISVPWGTTTIMVSCRVCMFMRRRSKDGSDTANRIAMRGLKLGNFCIASLCVLACFYVISHRVVGEGAVSCLVCMYGERSFVRVAWTRQVLPAACMQARHSPTSPRTT